MNPKQGLAPVLEGGLTVDSEVQRSWVIKDGQHPIVVARAEGRLLAIDFPQTGQEWRLSAIQADAVAEAVARWVRYRDE